MIDWRALLPALRWDQGFSLVLGVAALSLLPLTAPRAVETQPQPEVFSLRPVEVIPVPHNIVSFAPTSLITPAAATSSALLEVSAASVFVMDVESGATLYEKNADTPVSPASTTKLMTALVAREQYALDTVLEVGAAAHAPGTTAGLFFEETVAVEHLLQALLVKSGNDAAMVFAQHYPGGTPAFVAAMNQKAADLHLTHTSFQNPAGFDHSRHLTTARDLAILGKEVMKDSVLRQIVGLPEVEFADVTGSYNHRLLSTNRLLTTDPSVVGIKTGTTEQAGQVLITQALREEKAVIVVLLGSIDRFSETTRVLDWVYATYRWVPVAELRSWYEQHVPASAGWSQ